MWSPWGRPRVGMRGRLILFIAAATTRLVIATLPPIIRIGAVFTEDQKDSSSELAFKYAVYRINKDKTLLPNTTIVYDIQYVPRDDSFRTSKKVCRQLESGVQALFGPSDGTLGTHIQSICEALDVPHIEARSDAEPVPKEFSINLYPAPRYTAQAFQDLLSFLGWSRMAVIYEDETGLFRRHDFVNSASKPDVYILQTNPASYREVLKDIKRKQIFNLVVDTNPEYISKFFRAILQLQMNDDRYHYLFTTYDIEVFDLEDFKYNGVNMTAFRLVDVTSPSVMKALEQMERFQPIGKAILNKNRVIQAEPALMYDSVHVFATGLTAMDTVQALRPTNLSCDLEKPFDGGLSLYNYINSASIDGLTGKIEFNEGKRNNFKLDLMNLRKEELHKVGEWTPATGVHIFPETDEIAANITFVVVTKLEKPYVMLKEESNMTGNTMYEGFCIDLLKLIARKVGFRYTIRLVPDNMYGSYDPQTHQWNGIVGELVHRQADIAVAPITIDRNRENVVEFTKPFMNFGIGVLFKATKNQPKHIFSFMNPFDVKIWLYMLAAYVTVSLTFYAIARFSPHGSIQAEMCQQVPPDVVENQFTVHNSFWFITGTLLRRGSGLNPKATSKRIIGAVWWFFTLIIISSYTANLAAFRTVDYMISPIKSAADLADQDEIAFGTLKGGSTMNFFKDSNIDIYKKMWQNMIEKKSVSLVPTYEDGIQKTLKGNYAFLMESTMLDYTIRRNCYLKQIGGLLDSKNYGIATVRGFPFKNKISNAISELRQSGQIQKLYDKWWTEPSKNVCDQMYEPKANPLDGSNLGGLFLVLVCGLSIAVVVAIIEFYCNTHKKRYKTTSTNIETFATIKKGCADCSPAPMYTPTRINKDKQFQDSNLIQMVDMRKFSLTANKQP